MAALLEIKQFLKDFYTKYDVYLIPVLKFILAIVTLFAVNGSLGYMYRLQNPVILLVAALLYSFLPMNFLLVIAAGFVVAHAYALSMECAIVVLVIFLLMFLLYFRFSPGNSLAVILTPIFFVLKIPYLLPLAVGLTGNPFSAVSVGFGVIIYSVIEFIHVNSSSIAGTDTDNATQKLRYCVDGILNNRAAFILAMIFMLTVLLVYLVKRLSIDHSWTIAIISGAVFEMVLVFFGDMFLGMDISIVSVILGTLVSLALTFGLQFFVFSVDYSRTEHLQFEDDEYYYYVKAVPKMAVTMPERKVKHINNEKKNQRLVRINNEDSKYKTNKTPQTASKAERVVLESLSGRNAQTPSGAVSGRSRSVPSRPAQGRNRSNRQGGKSGRSSGERLGNTKPGASPLSSSRRKDSSVNDDIYGRTKSLYREY